MPTHLDRGERRSQYDFNAHPPCAAHYFERDLIARIHAAQHFGQLAQKLYWFARSADDEIVRLQAGLFRRPSIADAGDPYAAARFVKRNCAKSRLSGGS